MSLPESAPVFILGLHRSGTTILYEMLASTGAFDVLTAWHVIEFDWGDEALQSPEKL